MRTISTKFCAPRKSTLMAEVTSPMPVLNRMMMARAASMNPIEVHVGIQPKIQRHDDEDQQRGRKLMKDPITSGDRE